jgi:hypothetical protein
MPAGSKPGERRGGRTPGAKNKRTVALLDRLDALKCDPLELSARIALGQELDGPHPSLKYFRQLSADLAKAIEKEDDLSLFPSRLEELIEESLTRGYVPMDLRSKHIADLMQYAHPKRRAVEVTGEGGEPLNLVQVYLPDNARTSTD